MLIGATEIKRLNLGWTAWLDTSGETKSSLLVFFIKVLNCQAKDQTNHRFQLLKSFLLG